MIVKVHLRDGCVEEREVSDECLKEFLSLLLINGMGLIEGDKTTVYPSNNVRRIEIETSELQKLDPHR